MNNPLLVKRVIISVIAMILIASTAYLISTTSSRIGKTPIHLSAFPNDTTVMIDDAPIKIGTNYLNPGIYVISAKKEGFDDYNKTLVVEEEGQTIGIIMSPNTKETLEWAKSKENESEYYKVFGDAQAAATDTGRVFNEKNPIAKHLPYKTAIYSVGYRMDKSDPSGNSIIIEIDAIDGYRQSALYRIRQLGYDPTDFNINFREYENPFPL